ncbi:VrrA/YqfQ family protein [Bacillus solitudinis]|uniref:VrrA/YqfQ family protein n=1 Tax=Bacillus solitudinis TaxID=2014074 RepID=UPI000C23249A|nr:VrrA/YqfQ family protein [Bacillus solitudinis]
MQHYMGPPLGPLPMQPTQFLQPSMFQGMPMNAMGGFNPALAQGSSGIARGGGGLLARLFGGALNPSSAATFTGGLNPGASTGLSGLNFASMLQNTQRVLGITQQVVPMVQQYGPLIRNMPAIWRIMRSSDQSESEDTTPSSENDEPVVPVAIADETQLAERNVESRPSKKETFNGIPAPKIYI